jgi:hypothetical protein
MGRITSIQKLVNFDAPISELRALLSQLTWDYVGQPVILDKQSLASVLERVRHGEISFVDLEEWANMIELREDISFEKTATEKLESIIFELANPALTQQMSEKRISELVDFLDSN